MYRRARLPAALAFAAVCLPLSAGAQSPGASAAPGSVAGAPVAEIEDHPDVEAGVLNDANSGRVFVSPTALTAPAGTWSFNDYELVIVGASYAFTDNFSVSLSGLAPITDDTPVFLIGSTKLRLLRSSGWHVAAHGAVFYGSDDGDGAGVATLGGAVTRCLDVDCHSLLNAYLAAGIAIDPDVDQTSVPFIASIGYVQRLTNRLKLAVEGDFGFSTGEVNDVAEGLLLWYGARITSKNIGVDLGFARPICEDCDAGLALGLPWIGFTYRGI